MKLIESEEGILIEVQSQDADEKISAEMAEKVQKGLAQIQPVLQKACDATKDFFDDENSQLSQVQIEIGLNFEASGNIYICQAKAGASITLTATIQRP